MQVKYRMRDMSADVRPIRAPLVPMIQLQALGKQEATRSPTFGSVLTQASYTRSKRALQSRTRSNSQQRSRQPPQEATPSRDLFLFEEYRRADLVRARKLPCARSPYWHISFVSDSSELMIPKELTMTSTHRTALSKWLTVPLT